MGRVHPFRGPRRRRHYSGRDIKYIAQLVVFSALTGAVLPYARSGIIGAVILGLGRALGETMAVTMVIGNRHEIAASLFAPGYTMAAAIANEFTEAVENLHLAALSYVAVTLFVVTVLINAAARLLIWRVARGGGGRGA